MTDPQTAADAADVTEAVECVQTYLDGVDRVARAHGGQDYVFDAEDIVLHDAMRTLLADRKRMAAELEQVRKDVEHEYGIRGFVDLNGKTLEIAMPEDVARRCVADDASLGVHRRVLVRRIKQGGWCEVASAASAAPDATGDTQAGEQRADGKRTPEQWCAEYGIDIRDPDGWRGAGDPAWDEPITLPDFLRRAARSTTRGLTPDVWNRLSREAHEAADAEKAPEGP